MRLQGDLKDTTLFDVLQTLQQDTRSGVLVVQREGTTRRVHVDPLGVRLFYTDFASPLRLGEIFVRRGRLTQQDVEILLLQQKQTYRPIGELLVESGKVEQWEVDEILQYHAEDTVYELFGWESGSFCFYEGEDGGSGPVSAPLAEPAALCLEAARRLDALERLRRVVPDSAAHYIRKGSDFDAEQAEGHAAKIYESLAEPNSLDELRDLIGISRYHVIVAAAELAERGAIRPLDAAELVEAGRVCEQAGEFQRAAEMFEKSHQLDPSNAEALEDAVRAIQRIEDPKRLARHLRALGRYRLDLGQLDEGIELLEKSLRHDPDSQQTMHLLVEAFTKQGDQERSAELSLRMARRLADDGNPFEAIDVCRAGLRAAPASAALSFHLAQLLVRADRGADAQTELRRIVAEASKHASESDRARDLAINSYKLLLRIDPGDSEAEQGLRNIDRQRVNAMRKRGLLTRVTVAVALATVLGVVGVVSMDESTPESLLKEAEIAYQEGDLETVREIAYRMLDDYPDNPATQKAQGLRKKLSEQTRELDEVRTRAEKTVRAEYDEKWEAVKVALHEAEELEALTLAEPFLAQLEDKRVDFMRTSLVAQFEYEFDAFLERVLKRFSEDRQQLAVTEFKLRKTEHAVEALRGQEARLGQVRARKWNTLIPQLMERLRRIAAAKHAGKAADRVEAFVKKVEDAYGSFENIDHLYYTVRRKRLRLEINKAVSEAREKRLELLRHCEFARARALYQVAFTMADSIADERPREHFIDLIKWLEQTNTREDMKKRRDEIDGVIRSLAEVARLKEEGKTAEAYRTFRPLVLKYPVIQFEREHKMPFRVDSMPRGAEVLLDGKRVGVTPLPVELDIVKQTKVTVRRPGFVDHSVVLTATDPALTGELRAQLRKRTAWARTIGGRVEARPAIAEGKLLVATSNANLLALDLKAGGVVWEASTRLLDRVASAPVPMGEHVALITVGGLLHHVRLSDGEVREEKLSLPGQVLHDAAFDGTTLFVATSNRRLVAVRDSKLVYDSPIALPPSTRVLLHGELLYIGTASGQILVHLAKTGREIRRLQPSNNTSLLGGIQAFGDLVVAGAEDGRVYAFHHEHGKEQWRYGTGGPIEATPVSSGGLLYVPAADGRMHIVDPKGRGEATYNLQIASKFTPAMSDGFLYATAGTRVFAFDSQSRRPWWEFVLEKGDGEPEHVIASDGSVVVITSTSRIVAFPADNR